MTIRRHVLVALSVASLLSLSTVQAEELKETKANRVTNELVMQIHV
jgi:hypothetical protein